MAEKCHTGTGKTVIPMRYGWFVRCMQAATALHFATAPLAFSATSTIFHWKDNYGTPFFTDDLSQIPLQYRRPPYLQVVPGTAPMLPAEAKPEAKSSEKSTDKDKDEGSKKTTADDKSLQAEKAAIGETIDLFSSEVQNDTGFAQMMPNLISGNKIGAYVISTLPAKKQLAEKLAKFESPVLVEAAGFLKKNIAEDEDVKPHSPYFKRKIIGIIARIKQELPTKTELLEKLKKASAAEPSQKTEASADEKKAEKEKASVSDKAGDQQTTPRYTFDKNQPNPQTSP